MKTANLGEIIRKGRERMGLSKSELARLMDVSHAAVTYWESGTNFPSAPCLIMLMKRLNIVQDVFPEYFTYPPQHSFPSTESILHNETKTLEERVTALENGLSSKVL